MIDERIDGFQVLGWRAAFFLPTTFCSVPVRIVTVRNSVLLEKNRQMIVLMLGADFIEILPSLKCPSIFCKFATSTRRVLCWSVCFDCCADNRIDSPELHHQPTDTSRCG
jgi:hypothetical protein